MSLKYAIKRGDTYPSVRLAVTGLPSGMADATVQFIARVPGQETATINAEADFETPNILFYDWGTGETGEAMTLDAEFEVTLSGGGVFTCPGCTTAGVPQFIRIVIAEDIGDAETMP